MNLNNLNNQLNQIVPNEPASQINQLMLEREQLNSELELRRGQGVLAAHKVTAEISRATTMLEMLSMHLMSLNQLIEKDITQLKVNHVKELESMYTQEKTKINLVAAQIKNLFNQITIFQLDPTFSSENNFHLPSIELLKGLEKDISDCNYPDLKAYPEYSDLRNENERNGQELLPICPESTAKALIVQEPILKDFIMESLQTYRNLKIIVTPLQDTYQSNLDKQEIMINFNTKYIEQIRKDELPLPFKKVLKLLNFAFDSIQWANLITRKPDLYFDDISEGLRQLYYNGYQRENDKKTTLIKELMQGIITGVEAHMKKFEKY